MRDKQEQHQNSLSYRFKHECWNL